MAARTLDEGEAMMDKKTIVRETTITVKKHFKTSQGFEKEQEAEEETLEVRKFETAPAQVGVEYGLTLNLGNFESARIAVSVSVPAYAEEIEAAHKWAEELVTKKVMDQVVQIRAAKGTPSGSVF